MKFENFIKENAKYWQNEISYSSEKDIILAEGLFAEAGPNYAIRVGIIAKALEEKYHIKPFIFLRQGINKEKDKKNIWSSFNLKNFIGMEEDIIPNLNARKIRKIAKKLFYYTNLLLFFKQYDKIFNLSYKGVRFGDMLYDEIFKYTGHNYNISKISKNYR